MSEELNREREELAGLAQRFGLPQTVSGEAFPPSQEGAPLIIDTDAGGDPDDAIALVIAAAEPSLALVSTVDELGGRRARFVRHLLDLLGREDVPVVAGADLGDTRMDCIAGLVPDSVAPQRTNVAEAVGDVVAKTGGLVRWAGMGPVTNLAALLTGQPDLAERLVVTQMGGALNYRDPERAEHNFRLDPAAAEGGGVGSRAEADSPGAQGLRVDRLGKYEPRHAGGEDGCEHRRQGHAVILRQLEQDQDRRQRRMHHRRQHGTHTHQGVNLRADVPEPARLSQQDPRESARRRPHEFAASEF